jgi:prefoldin subunit 5
MVTIEERVSRLEGAFEQLSMTLQSLENRITNLESRMTIMWATTMGTMVAGFITLFVAIMLTR